MAALWPSIGSSNPAPFGHNTSSFSLPKEFAMESSWFGLAH